MGHRGSEVGTPQAPQSGKDIGISYGKIVSYEELCEHIFGKPRKPSLADGTKSKIRKSGNR
jgi:hypothetical protein